jgi:dienelactone hydrolase
MTAKCWVTLAIALVGWLTANDGRAGTLVQFANVPEHAKPTQLLGYLARPDGTGPFRTVVGLHGCMGISSHSVAIDDRLKALGYVALAIDSLGPRGRGSVRPIFHRAGDRRLCRAQVSVAATICQC